MTRPIDSLPLPFGPSEQGKDTMLDDRLLCHLVSFLGKVELGFAALLARRRRDLRVVSRGRCLVRKPFLERLGSPTAQSSDFQMSRRLIAANHLLELSVRDLKVARHLAGCHQVFRCIHVAIFCERMPVDAVERKQQISRRIRAFWRSIAGHDSHQLITLC